MTHVPAAFDPPIRRAKLLPPPRGDGLVSRPRLTAHLDQSLRAPLTLIAAPAGFGKTTLLSEWAGSQRVPLGWLTLDARDRDLRRFLPHLIAMVQRLLPGLADTVLDQQRRGAGTAAELGAALADALLDLPYDIVLVIDDYHLAASTAVEGFLGGLLQHPAPACHLLLATRISSIGRDGLSSFSSAIRSSTSSRCCRRL